MAIHKVVTRLKNGKILKGRTNDFFPEKKSFHITLITNELVELHIEELKAIFFIKDFKGNKDHVAKYKDSLPWGGNKIKVVFSDGEEITGYTQHFSQDVHGFFITPADLKSNNERIFIIVSATDTITFI